jgi:hypothetical protein
MYPVAPVNNTSGLSSLFSVVEAFVSRIFFFRSELSLRWRAARILHLIFSP